MLTRFFFADRNSILHLLRLPTQSLRVCCFVSLMVSSVIFSEASSGQKPLPVAPSDQVGRDASPSSEKAKPNSSPGSAEPLTRQASESSPEIAPADRRVMSDIQEIRAMLGGGLEREFEEINRVLEQNPASMVSPASHDQGSGEITQEDRGANARDELNLRSSNR